MSLLGVLPLRGKVILTLDRIHHKIGHHPRFVCDAWDLYVGMDGEDFMYNDGRLPSKWAYRLAGVKQ